MRVAYSRVERCNSANIHTIEKWKTGLNSGEEGGSDNTKHMILKILDMPRLRTF